MWSLVFSKMFHLIFKHAMYKALFISALNLSQLSHLLLEIKEPRRFPVDAGRTLNVRKTFRRRPGRLLSVLCTFNLRFVSMGLLAKSFSMTVNEPCRTNFHWKSLKEKSRKTCYKNKNVLPKFTDRSLFFIFTHNFLFHNCIK